MRSLDGYATHRDDTRFTGRVCHIAVIVLAVVSSGCDNVHARIDGFVGCVPRCSPKTMENGRMLGAPPNDSEMTCAPF